MLKINKKQEVNNIMSDNYKLKLIKNNEIIASYDIDKTIAEEIQTEYASERKEHKRKVKCCELDLVFKSAKQASKYILWTENKKDFEGIKIRKCCKGEIEQVHNYHWEFTDEPITPIDFRKLLFNYSKSNV